MVFRRNATYRCNRIPQCGSITLARRRLTIIIYKRIDTCTHAQRTDAHGLTRAHATHDRPVLRRRRRNVPPIPLTTVFPQLVGGPPPPPPPPRLSAYSLSLRASKSSWSARHAKLSFTAKPRACPTVTADGHSSRLAGVIVRRRKTAGAGA